MIQLDISLPSQLPVRHLPLVGTFNLRDVGGYTTADGRCTKWRTLLRADSLHRISAEVQLALIDMGLHTVIDLRFPWEVSQASNVFAAPAGSASVRYRNIPLMPATPPNGSPLPSSLIEMYRGLLDNCQPAIKSVIDVLSESDSAPVLVHCTAGKDRTGIIVALVLGAVGVAEDDIIADYALTEGYIAELLTELRQQNSIFPADVYEKILECRPEFMADTLAYIRERYGSITDYLQHIGITNRQISQLQDSLLEPVGGKLNLSTNL